MRREEQRRPNRWAAPPKESGQDTPEDTAPTLFEPEPEPRPWTHDLWAAERRRRAGEAAALQAASRAWREEAEAEIERLAHLGQPFTAEDVRATVGDAMGPSQCSFGALFSAASKAGIIRQHGWTTAKRPEANGRGLRTWIGAGGDL